MADQYGIGNAATGVAGAALGGFTNPLTDISAIIGLGQTGAGLLGLNKVPAYQSEQIDPKVIDMLNESQKMAKQGFSPEQISQFHNDTVMNDTARFRHGTDMSGGNLASAVKDRKSV